STRNAGPFDRTLSFALPFMTGHHRDHGSQASISQRNPGVGGHPGSARDPGDDLKRDAPIRQKNRFFPAAPKKKRVATLQARHNATALRLTKKKIVDLRLLHGMMFPAF